ncbi:hypothetical protein PsYK624_119450 [Phanerochaete sordida]|uniref:Uncharacterized protein n=1 Tax=Phanerochaete sordida TaxID=48140 RepID=A0A9P3LI55_9APHY|nr:hypothetical protein PsYK624_119450 [Phanerochaete sordida]
MGVAPNSDSVCVGGQHLPQTRKANLKTAMRTWRARGCAGFVWTLKLSEWVASEGSCGRSDVAVLGERDPLTSHQKWRRSPRGRLPILSRFFHRSRKFYHSSRRRSLAYLQREVRWAFGLHVERTEDLGKAVRKRGRSRLVGINMDTEDRGKRGEMLTGGSKQQPVQILKRYMRETSAETWGEEG